MRTFYQITFLLLVAGFIFFFKLGDMALTDPDEVFYAETAREMQMKGDLVTPYIFDRPQFEKPIMYYWLILGSYKVFGVNEFAARFPSAVFGLIGIIGVYFLARIIFSSSLAGVLSGFIMATSMEYFVLAKACVTDMVLGVFFLFCCLFFVLGITREKGYFYVLSAVMAALAVLTKGPVGVLLPGLVFMVYLCTGGRISRLKKIPVFWCVLAFLAVCLPWYMTAAHIHGTTFLSEFFGFQNITRFTTAEHKIGSSPFFYLPVVIGGMFPWSVFLFFGTYVFFKEHNVEVKLPGYKLFLAAWFLTVFVFFSASSSKLVTYIFPLFPVLAVILGRSWELYLKGGEANSGNEKGMRITNYIYFILCFVGLLAAYFVIKKEYEGPSDVLLSTSVYLIGAVVLSAVLFAFGKRLSYFLSIGLMLVIFIVPSANIILPIIDAEESNKEIVAKLMTLAAPGEALGGEDDHRRGIAFYAKRADITDVHTHDKLAKFFSRQDRVWAVIRTKHYEERKSSMKDLNIYMEPVFTLGKKVIVTNKPYYGIVEGK